MSSTVTGGEGQIQLTSFRKEAKKGSAKVAVLIAKDIHALNDKHKVQIILCCLSCGLPELFWWFP